MLNWYRVFRKGSFLEKIIYEIVFYWMIWGMEDCFLSRKFVKEMERYCMNGYFIFVDEVFYWINYEKLVIVNYFILEYFKK